MKRHMVIIMVSIMSVVSMSAQIEEETFYFGLNSTMSLTSLEPNVERFDTVDYREDALFEFTPSFGMFFSDNFLLGLSFPLKYLQPGVDSNDVEISVANFMIAPFTKYYFDLFNEDQMKLILNGEVGYGIHNNEDSIIVSYKLGVGFAYFLNKNMSVDLNLNYSYESREPRTDVFYTTGYKEFNKGLEPSIGFYYYLFK